MTVRTHDIALGDLLQDACGTGPPDHPRHGRPLRCRVPVVEVHRAGRVGPTAVGARALAEYVQHPGLRSPARAATFDPGRGPVRLSTRGRAAPLCPDPVTVGAHDVALRRLFANRGRGSQRRPTGCQSEPLDGRVTVIEVHLVGGEPTSAIHARIAPHFPEEIDGPLLADAHPSDLELPVPPVVGDVRGALVAARHASG